MTTVTIIERPEIDEAELERQSDELLAAVEDLNTPKNVIYEPDRPKTN